MRHTVEKLLRSTFPNIYSFNGQNLLLFELNSFIIYTILCEKIKTHLHTLKYQKLHFEIMVNNIDINCHLIVDKNKLFYSFFSICGSQDIGI